jgi:diguanylate cyclase (GGDEF)-like protein/PAS domain S-box-containing protein
LHALLAAVIALTCVALVGLDGWRTWHARTVALNNDEAATLNLARSLSQHAHDMILNVDTVLADLGERIVAGDTGPIGLARMRRVMLDHLSALPALHALVIYDATGTPVVGTAPPGTLSSRIADRDYFRYHQEHRGTGAHIGGMFRSKLDGSSVMTVSRRLETPDGAFAGIALASIDIDALDRFYARFDVGRHGVISLVLADGSVVARFPRLGAMNGINVSANEVFRNAVPRLPYGSFRYVSTNDGTVRLGSYRLVDGYPMHVMVAHSLEDVLAECRSDALAHLAVTLCITLAVAFLGSRLVRQIRSRQTAERQYRLLADHSNDAIVCADTDGRQLYVSPFFTSLTGWSTAEGQAGNWAGFAHPDDVAAVEDALARLRTGAPSVALSYRLVCRDAPFLWVEARCHVAPVAAGGTAQCVINIRDISERKAAEEQLEALNRLLAEQANTDTLTGLANRRRFDAALAQAWRRSAREQIPLSLLLIDVDCFKLFNDTYGHPAGDECLARIGGTIAGLCRRPDDLAARYGGEEIAVLLPGAFADGAAEVAAAMQEAILALAIPHAAGTPLRIVTASFGAATLCPQHPTAPPSAAELVALADAAL